MSEILTLIKILNHNSKVSYLLKQIAGRLELRAMVHDTSKFEVDEFTGFCQLDENGQHKKEQYGSKSYEDGIKLNAVKLHHARNSHHPEFYQNGINDMSFSDIVEMLCDWEIARQQRDTEQDINKIWQVRQERFKLSDNEIYFLRVTWEKILNETRNF